MMVQPPAHLLATLDELGYADDEGLVTTATELPAGGRDYIWNDLKFKVGLDAAFFRDGIPLIGFTGQQDSEGLAGLRRRLWNYGRVPVLISAGQTTARAYNAVSYSNRIDTENDALVESNRADTASQLAEAFRRANIESGFFAARYSRSYSNSQRVDAALLNNLRYLRTSSSEAGSSQRAAIDALIGGTITATYLAQKGILTARYLSGITGFESVEDILDSGLRASRVLFENLADHFNGDVFGPLPEIIETIDPRVLEATSSLLRGDDLTTGQQSLWPYDFRVLPTDLVSSIYEQLLEETRSVDAAYYTPRFLVNMILDETIPWGGVGTPTIVDPACGSGAFITEAYRRLCYREQRRIGRDLTYPALQTLLREHIYGIDRNEVAARTAVFGLYLTLLEQLDPPTIWQTAVLPTLLNENIIVSDSFEPNSLTSKRFDVVVSNPPWKSSLPTAAARFVREQRLPVADKQIASAFLWLAASMLRPGGTLGLVMPAKPLLYNRSSKAEQFRSAIMQTLTVHAFIDLSAIRRMVFRNAVGPAAVIVAELPDPESRITKSAHNDQVLHVAAHPRQLGATLDALTITPEEMRGISRKLAESRPDIWKPLLWGSTRDIELLDQLRTTTSTLGDLAVRRSWVSGQGYQVGGGDENDASELIGIEDISTESVRPLRVVQAAGIKFRLPYLHRPRDVRLFRGPHVLIRRTIIDGRIAAALVGYDAVFPNGVIGIAGPEEDRLLLATVAAVISSSLARYWHFMTSASWGVEREFVELGEHLSLPFPLPSTSEAMRFLEMSLATNAGGEELSQLDELVYNLYGLDPEDRRRIDNFISKDLPRFLKPVRAYAAPASREWLQAYGDALAGALGSSLGSLAARSFPETRGDYCTVAVVIGPPDQADEDAGQTHFLAVDAESIVRAQLGNQRYGIGVFAQPAGFFVADKTIYIVKTADRDRWSRDAALDDADRIFTALAFGGIDA